MRHFSSIFIFFSVLGIISGQGTAIDTIVAQDSVFSTIDDSFQIIEDIEISDKKDSLITEYVEIRGKVYPVIITDNDTLVLANIDDVSLSSPRSFENADDYRRYRKYKYYAAKVYPFALEAIKAYKTIDAETADMSRRKRKKYIKSKDKELKEKFEDPLMGLSKTQGKILVKMIERELDEKMYDVIKELRGKFKAFYWNQSSKLYGYRLKQGYTKGENPILDIVLQDFDISYEVPEKESH